MFSRKRTDDDRRVISNLVAQNEDAWQAAVAASRESERRIAELQRERDEWRAKAIACGQDLERMGGLLATLGMEQK